MSTITAVIMAGGKGTRLHPYTFVLPKPMMPVGGQPVIEILLKWLRRSGIGNVCITTGYLGHIIRALCGDGSHWDMDISYSEEPEPLGTIGALLLLKEQLTDTFLVLNGDLITDLDIRKFVQFHQKHGADLTVAVTKKEISIDFGVITHSKNYIIDFLEKPKLSYEVSMGVYCMEPKIIGMIPKNVPFGFDSLVAQMLAINSPVCIYRHEGLWMDIGRAEDFLKAQQSFMTEYKSLILGA